MISVHVILLVKTSLLQIPTRYQLPFLNLHKRVVQLFEDVDRQFVYV